MPGRKLLLSSVLIGTVALAGHPRAQDPASPTATLHAVGHLVDGEPAGVASRPPGSVSIIRDATRADGVIYAVGGAAARECTATSNGCGETDTALLWRFDGTNPPTLDPNPTLEALPNIAANTTSANLLTAYAITPDGAFIASQARSATTGARRAVRVSTSGLPSSSANLDLFAFPSFPVSPSASPLAAVATSSDGTILYGNRGAAGGLLLGVRIDTGSATNSLIPFVDASDTQNPVAERGASADGIFAVGSSFSTASNHKAYRYAHGSPGVTAIPFLPGGTFNDALAVSPDGVLVLVTGNSDDYPNGEAYLYDFSKLDNPGTPEDERIKRLGSPNAPLSPGSFLVRGCACGPTLTGGMTADGSVVVMSFIRSPQGGEAFYGEQAGYFWNEHGWFHLTSALGANGVDFAADGWSMEGNGLQISGISSDGTLVFGAGARNGKFEGFVADFAAADVSLAEFNPQAEEPESTDLVGVWTFVENPDDPAPTDPNHVVVLTEDGVYYHIEGEPGEPLAGFERGLYTLDGNQSVITTLFDTNGSTGLSDSNGLTFSNSVNGDTLQRPNGQVVAYRITGSPSSILGGWVGGNPTQAHNSFVQVFAGSRYFVAYDFSEGIGSDVGTYAWDPGSGELIATSGGVVHPSNFLTLSADGLGLHVVDPGGDFDLRRVVARNTVLPAITNTSLEASGAEDSAFTPYTVTAVNALSFAADGLPTGLSIDANTGVISGTPAVNGTFNVEVTVTNTFGDTGTATLVLTFAAPPARFYGIGDLDGGAVGSAVRDATRVNGTLYAVGSSVARNQTNLCNNFTANDPVAGCLVFPNLESPAWWQLTGTGPGTLAALPEPAAHTTNPPTNQMFAHAISKDAEYIAGQTHFTANATNIQGIRYTNTSGTLSYFNQPLSGAVFAMSDDGATLYGGNASIARRIDVVGTGAPGTTATVTDLPLPAGTTQSQAIARGTSSTGAYMMGVAWNAPVGTALGPSNGVAFRYTKATHSTAVIPTLTGGSWNYPVAISSIGAQAVVAGNSAAFPNGEIYLTDGSNVITEPLGSPNTALVPKALGGITADGAIVVTFGTGGNNPTALQQGGRYAYVRNSFGWYNLSSVLVAQDIDLVAAGWDPTNMAVTGVRTIEGIDLVFGQGRRRVVGATGTSYVSGAQEGFVAELPAGTLAAFNPTPTAPADDSMVGTWLSASNPVNPNGVLSFMADGTYVRINPAIAPVGFEGALYSWAGNAAGGDFAVTTLYDTDGTNGNSFFNGVLGRTMIVTGNTLTFADTKCPGCPPQELPRVASSPGSIVGGWIAAYPTMAENFLLAVFTDALGGNKAYFATHGPLFGGDRVVVRAYTWEPGTGALVVTPLGGSPDAPDTATLSRDDLSLQLIDAGRDLITAGSGTFDLTRIVAPSSVVPLFTAPMTASGTVAVPFEYTIPATHALTFTASELPDGLTLEETTGVISGMPTTTGTFTIDVMATNTFGAPAEGELVITIRATQAALLIGPPSAVYGSTFGVSLGGGSGTGTFSYEISGGCAPSGSDVTMTSGTVGCTITAHREGDDLYWETSATHIVAAVQKPASVTPSPAGKVYGTSDPPLSGSLSGFLPANGVTAAYSRAPGENVLGSPYLITATLSPTGVLGNYDITDNSAAFTITKASSSTALTSSLNPSSPGLVVNFVATVTGQYGGAVTGTVTFRRGQNTVLGTAAVQPDGTATLPLSTLGNGSHVITADYAGDANSTASTSPSVTQNVVAPAAPTATTLTSSLNPSIVGQSVTLTATVTSGTPGTITGTVTFKRGLTELSTEPVSAGQATYTTTTLPQGSLSLTAVYNGDAQYITSTSAVLNQVVTMASTTTSLISSPNPSNGNGPVTLTASITSGTPGATGTVTFKRGQTVLGTGSVSGGQASMTTTTLPAGSSNLTAVYSGDATHTGSTSPAITHVVNTATSTTTLSSMPNPSTVGLSVQYTAVVVTSTGAIATGTVSLKKGGTTLATEPLTSGVATFNLSTLGVGNHNLRAVYAGDAYTSNSTSNTYTQRVVP